MNAPIRLHIPIFHWPWQLTCSPYAQLLDLHVFEWVDKYHLVTDEASRARIAQGKFGWLAARCYPTASLAMLQAIAAYLTWLFVVDDVIFDQPHPPSPETISAVTAIFDVLEQEGADTTSFFAEPAWRDICRQFKPALGVERLQHFAHGIRMMYGSTALLLLGYLHELPITVTQYETLRRYSIGLIPSFELLGLTPDRKLRDSERYSPAVQKLTALANNIISWSNDLYSLGDELEQRGRYENIVIAYVSHGDTLQDAITRVTGRIANEFTNFTALCKLLSEQKSPPLDTYIQELQTWIVGHQIWMQNDTARYLKTLTNCAWEHYVVDFENNLSTVVSVDN